MIETLHLAFDMISNIFYWISDPHFPKQKNKSGKIIRQVLPTPVNGPRVQFDTCRQIGPGYQKAWVLSSCFEPWNRNIPSRLQG